MTVTTKDSVNKICVNSIFILLFSVLSWLAGREIARNDRQDDRIVAVEVRLESVHYLQRDVTEIKADLKKLLHRSE